MSLRNRLKSEIIVAMKSKEDFTRNTLRSIMAKIKQYEVDNKADLTNDDATILTLVGKMIKERKESIVLFEQASRTDLVDKERNEIEIISKYLPEQLSEDEVRVIVEAAIKEVNPTVMKDMGKVMAIVKPKIQGRGDIGFASNIIKKVING
jgi:uncharacterized protein YqeY